jgi:hypothetical protein
VRWAALCPSCANKAEVREFCTKDHMAKRECEWCSSDFHGGCSMMPNRQEDVCSMVDTPKVAP